ncbi:MAG: LacI family DNA-binding transcriptional regulator [Pseudomonadota bacterium]|nr:LacI family DNA-binding transcriptional regulator [Pseudomonadota bacterium]
MNDITAKPAQDRVTIKDVAKKAGVSDISVSRVMRNAPNISAKLREKVTAAADELGYTPNRLAGALKTRSSNLVAVIVPSMSNAVFPEVLDGIDSVLAENGFQAALGITHYDKERELQVVRDMLAWSPMGVILAGTDQDERVRQLLLKQAIPVVQMMDIDSDPIQVAVGMSHRDAAYEVAERMVAKGYKKFGYIGAWGERPDRSKLRRLSFEEKLSELGCPLIARLIRDENSSAQIGAQATQALLAENPDIDCIFYANDDLAVGGYFHCMSQGISVPEGLAIVGFNGIDLGQALPSKLTSVKTPRITMGKESASILLRCHNGAEVAPIHDLGFELMLEGTA